LKGNAFVQAQQGNIIHDVTVIVLLMDQLLLNAHIHNRWGTLLLASLLPAVLIRGDAVLTKANLVAKGKEYNRSV